MTHPGFRPGTLDDVEFLTQLMYGMSGARLDASAEAEWLDGTRADIRKHVLGGEPGSTTYVIEAADGRRVGRLRVVRTAERIYLAGIQISPTYQNQGTGTAVITELLREARERRLPLELNVHKQNPDAERLYTRLGFRRRAEDGDDYIMTIS